MSYHSQPIVNNDLICREFDADELQLADPTFSWTEQWPWERCARQGDDLALVSPEMVLEPTAVNSWQSNLEFEAPSSHVQWIRPQLTSNSWEGHSQNTDSKDTENWFLTPQYNQADTVDFETPQAYVDARLQTVPSLQPIYPISRHSVSSMGSASRNSSLGSVLSAPFLLTEEERSRQSSVTSSSLIDDAEMLRVDSCFSRCSLDARFALDDDRAFSHFLLPRDDATGTLSPESTTSMALSNTGDVCYEFSDLPDESPTRSSVSLMDMGTHGHPKNFSSGDHLQERQITTGQSILKSSTFPILGARDDAGWQIHHGNKQKANGTTAVYANRQPSTSPCSASIFRPLTTTSDSHAHGTTATIASSKRGSMDKLFCQLCDEFPEGFRGDHELKRHHNRAHAEQRKGWICIDVNTQSKEGWRPPRPLNTCKQCMDKKSYNVYYNAAAHLRRAHFNPRKRGRRPRGEQHEVRAGKAGGNWPPIDWLKNHGWMQEVDLEGPSSSPQAHS